MTSTKYQVHCMPVPKNHNEIIAQFPLCQVFGQLSKHNFQNISFFKCCQ